MYKRVPKNTRKGFCKACGCKLTTEKSISRGFGQKCFDKNSMVVLDINTEGSIVVTRRVVEPMRWVFDGHPYKA